MSKHFKKKTTAVEELTRLQEQARSLKSHIECLIKSLISLMKSHIECLIKSLISLMKSSPACKNRPGLSLSINLLFFNTYKRSKAKERERERERE